MFLRLFLLFTLVPLLELYLLIRIGEVVAWVNGQEILRSDFWAEESLNCLDALGLDASDPGLTADVVFTFLLQDTNDRLKEKLRQELRPGTRIVSNIFTFSGFPLAAVERVGAGLDRLGQPAFVGGGEQRPVVMADPPGPRATGGNRGLGMAVGAGHEPIIKHPLK